MRPRHSPEVDFMDRFLLPETDLLRIHLFFGSRNDSKRDVQRAIFLVFIGLGSFKIRPEDWLKIVQELLVVPEFLPGSLSAFSVLL